MITKEIQDFLLEDSVNRFLRYVQIWTTSEESSETYPTTECQFELGKVLVKELKELNLQDIVHDKYGFVYARLPASQGYENIREIGLIAHLDTSEAVSGKDVKPVIHKNYDGGVLTFPNNEDLTLSISDSPELNEYIGLDIITSQGDTLLGADDKAGIAEIMAACAAWNKFPELKHGPITICFFPDEETGKGMHNLDLKKLPKYCYTLDGGEMGELEFECFDAWRALISFLGLSVHPGSAKNRMLNAISIASRFLSELPEAESPEHTEEREGFYHLSRLKGTAEKAKAKIIIRDFEYKNNQHRMEFLEKLKSLYETRYPGLKIVLEYEHQYENMYKYLKDEEKVIDLAKKAIESTGLELKVHLARGGTDGAHLSAKGIPTPNLFTGGLLFHSRKEYIPTLALQKASEVLILLADLWSNE